MWKVYKERVEEQKELRDRFSKGDREVFRNVLWHCDDAGVRAEAFHELEQRYSSTETGVNPSSPTSEKIDAISFESPEEIIFSYCEFYIDLWRMKYRLLKGEKIPLVERLSNFFDTRGLLYGFNYNKEENKIEIYSVASDKMREAHTKAKTLLYEKGWEREAELLNEAISYFKKGRGGYGSALKVLYSALEVALKHTLSEISDLAPKEIEKKTISQLVGALQSEGFFEGAEGGYAQHLSDTIKKLGAVVGGKRKEADHPATVRRHQVLFCIYGVDNCMCYLINQLREIKSGKK